MSIAGRKPVDQLEALGHPTSRAPVEDSARWHLIASDEAIDDSRWDVARAAVERARESVERGSPDEDEAAFVSLRLAVATVDLRGATADIVGLVERSDATDDVWNRRVRSIIAAAPPVFPSSMRTGLLSLIPPLPGISAGGEARQSREAPQPETGLEVPYVAVPPEGLPELPGAPWPEVAEAGGGEDAASALPPIPKDSPFTSVAEPNDGSAADDGDPVVVFDSLETAEEPDAFADRIVVDGQRFDLTAAESLRDHLVEAILSTVTEAEGRLLFETATTFLGNHDFGTAEVLFSAGMQLPELRVACCEGLMKALLGAERFSEAVSTGSRALRIFAREGDALLGIVYLNGCAAQSLGDSGTARQSFDRVAESSYTSHFPDLDERRAALR